MQILLIFNWSKIIIIISICLFYFFFIKTNNILLKLYKRLIEQDQNIFDKFSSLCRIDLNCNAIIYCTHSQLKMNTNFYLHFLNRNIRIFTNGILKYLFKLSLRQLLDSYEQRFILMHKYLSNALNQQKFNQVVFIGNGFDCLSLIVQKNEVNFYEIDNQQIVNTKKQLLNKIPQIKKIIYCSYEKDESESISLLQKNGFQEDQKTIFICNGNLSFLKTKAAKEIIKDINQVSQVGSLLFAWDWEGHVKFFGTQYGIGDSLEGELKEWILKEKKHIKSNKLMFELYQKAILQRYFSFIKQKNTSLIQQSNSFQFLIFEKVK